MNISIDFDRAKEIIKEINKVGLSNPGSNDLSSVTIFSDIYENSRLKIDLLDSENDCLTYKELLTRYLYLSCVLDQGPEIGGIASLLVNVTNRLYNKGIRFLHKPSVFLKIFYAYYQ